MAVIPEHATLEEVRTFFANDRFASQACGAIIVEASKGHAVCEMTICDSHKNAMGAVMGGALFTLADYALAIACNIGEEPTVAVANTIEYLNAARGEKLRAECTTDKSGQTLGFYTVCIHDDLGTYVAKMIATCSRKSAK